MPMAYDERKATSSVPRSFSPLAGESGKRKFFLTRICDLKIEHRELAVVHTRSKTKSLHIIQGPPDQLEEVMVDKIGIKQRKRFGFPARFTSSSL